MLVGEVNQIVITATNLSEDGSLLSSNEDELLFLLFEYAHNRPDGLIVEATFTFDQTNRTFTTTVEAIGSDTHMLVVLVELDSTRPSDQISDQVKNHHAALLRAYKMHDLAMIETILDDDDLLGIQVLDSSDREINFNGSWRMDRYAYRINLVARQ